MNGVAEFLALIALGFVSGKGSERLTQAVEAVTQFSLKVFLPALILTAVVSLGQLERQSVVSLLLMGVSYGCMLLLGWGVERQFRLQGQAWVAGSQMNCGYLGIPAAGLLGGLQQHLATVYCTLITPAFILVAERVFCREGENRGRWQILTDRYMVTFFVGLLIIPWPSLQKTGLFQFIVAVSKATPFVMLFILGFQLAGIPLSHSTFRHALKLTVIRFATGAAVAAVVVWFALWIFPNTPIELLEALTLQSLTPMGVFAYFIAIKNGRNIKDFGAGILLSTSLWLVVFIPLIMIRGARW